MRNTTLVTLFLVFLVAISFSFIETSEPGFENLKVLPANTNKYQMDSVMKHFSAALGVNCDFCHVQGNDAQKNWDFASDRNKHKEESRDMYRMMMEINEKYFGVEKAKEEYKTLAVSCYSCHQGNKHPQTVLPTAVKKDKPWLPGH